MSDFPQDLWKGKIFFFFWKENLAHDVTLYCTKKGGMTVRKVADVTEEELEECESKKLFDAYAQEFLYVKMTSKRTVSKGAGGHAAGLSVKKRRSRWPTLDQLRPKLKRASELETSLEEEQQVLINSSGGGLHKPASGVPMIRTNKTASAAAGYNKDVSFYRTLLLFLLHEDYCHGFGLRLLYLCCDLSD